jgi:nucleoside-diphosphate-sugar epimerase
MILVTGGTGFVGSHLLDTLSARGMPARCLLRPTAVPRRLPSGVEAAPGDLVTGQGLDTALRGVDTVIHLAGVTKALNPAGYYRGNVQATQTLANALAGRSVRFVHVSSLAAIGPSLDGSPVSEDAIPHPLTTYGRSKLEGERFARTLDPNCVIVRPPVVYGPRDTSLLQIFKSIARGVVLEIAGGDRFFSAIYVHDLVDGLLLAASHPETAGRDYFLSFAKPFAWSELSAAAAGIMGCRPRLIRIPVPVAVAIGLGAEVWSHLSRNPGIISREKVAEASCRAWICDTRRAADELGFIAPTPLEAGLAQTLAWYREAGWLKF